MNLRARLRTRKTTTWTKDLPIKERVKLEKARIKYFRQKQKYLRLKAQADKMERELSSKRIKLMRIWGKSRKTYKVAKKIWRKI